MIIDQIYDSDYAHLLPKRDSLFSDDDEEEEEDGSADEEPAQVKAEEDGGAASEGGKTGKESERWRNAIWTSWKPSGGRNSKRGTASTGRDETCVFPPSPPILNPRTSFV